MVLIELVLSLQYPKLCGMTGTAATEIDEFEKIYKLKVTVVPTNKPMIRKVQLQNLNHSREYNLSFFCLNRLCFKIKVCLLLILTGLPIAFRMSQM